MAEPFLCEIRLFSFGYAPQGWALCNGQLLPINQNQALFSLLGTTYGGDGRVNFGLPNFQGRTPIHVGNGHTLGEVGGEYGHTLNLSELPAHSHTVSASTAATGGNNLPNNRFVGGANNAYHPPNTPTTPLNPQTLTNAGGSQAHNNTQPYTALNFCIALQGIFPSQN
jgi:microcystin-dependent protein